MDMSASVMLGLMSAFCYGTTDFIARFAARRVGVLRTMVYAQWLAAALLTVAVVATRIPSGPLTSWTLLLGSNLVILAATALLYHALKVGRLAVVAPIVACYGGVTVILAAIGGEALDGYQWIGLGVLLIGVLLVARPANPITAPSRQGGRSGLFPAAAAALLYGTAFWIQGRWAIPVFGMLPCVWSYYLLGAVIVPMIGIMAGVSIRPPGGRDLPLVAATSLFAVTAYLSLAAGQSLGSVAVVTMLSSLASAVTVLLGYFLLKELILATGWIGLLAIIGGLVLIQL
jgi:drug/metabolite transporter (DMT)-like permease